MRSPTAILREEHRLILRALDTLERAAASEPPPGVWDGLLGWLRGFADRNHHAKEERSLFTAMAKAGVPVGGGPIAVMLEEHVDGRALFLAMEQGSASDRAARASEYTELLRAHIAKEEEIVFPLAEAVLDAPTVQGIAREFETVEAEMGRDASIAHADAALARLEAALSGGCDPVQGGSKVIRASAPGHNSPNLLRACGPPKSG